MNIMSPDIPMDDKQLKQPADDQKNAFYSAFDIHFNPVFNHFLKGTELKGRVSATLMKKFGDTYSDTDISNNNSSKKLKPNEIKQKSNNSVKSVKDDNRELGKPNHVKENSTHKKQSKSSPVISNKGNHTFIDKKANLILGLDGKTSLVDAPKVSDSSQNHLQPIEKVNKVQLISRISHIIQQKTSLDGSQAARYKIDGGQWGKLELKLSQNNINTQATLIVESETVKSIMEKIVTEIKENLNERGMKFESFNVEVETNTKNYDEEKWESKNVYYEADDEESNYSKQASVRQFGYNTIEILA